MAKTTMKATFLLTFAAVALLPLNGATLIGAYDLNGNFQDISANGNHATASANAPIYRAGQGVNGSGAYEFGAGSGLSYFELPIDINPSALSQVTFGAWVKPTATNSIRAIVSHDNGAFDRNLNIDVRGGGSYCGFTGSGVSCGSAPTLSAFDFVALRYDDVADTMQLSVNGVHFASVAANPGGGFNSTFVGINPGFGEQFVGLIDNVFLYNGLLTNAELDTLRREGLNAVPEPGSMILLASGAALLALTRRRKL